MLELQQTDGSWLELDECKFNKIDAETPVDVLITENEYWDAHSQGPHENKFTQCIEDLGWLRNVPKVKCVKVHKTVVKVVYEDNPNTIVRYDVPKDGKIIQELNDIYKNRELFESLPITITFPPPRRTHSLEYLRSAEKKEINKKHIEKLKAGKEIRPYTKPSTRGYRSGNFNKLFINEKETEK